ncbi:MAG: hypothetical protein AAB945_00395, partial [Patescibacteria group bacterium]
MIKKTKINNQSGAAMLLAIISFLFISLAIISGLVSPSVREFRNTNVNFSSKQSYFLAESGSEDAIYRIIKNMAISESEIVTLDSNSATTTITSINNSTKQIVSLGDVLNHQRKTNVTLSTSVGVSFKYGIQVGNGGLEMSNSSKVIGNAYSNGNIIGTNSARIQGTAIIGGPTGIIEGMD